MSGFFTEKKPFEKSHKVIDTEDLGLQAHKILVWRDPAEPVALGLLRIIAKQKEDLDDMDEEGLAQMDQDFFEYISQVFLDTNIEGVSFDTADDARAAFENPDIDWHFFYAVLVYYVGELFSKVDALKKT